MTKYHFKDCETCLCWKFSENENDEFYQSCRNRDFYEDVLIEYKDCPLLKKESRIL